MWLELFRVGEGTGEDDDHPDRSVNGVNGAVNAAYGSTSQLPQVAINEKSNMNHSALPPIHQKSPPPPYDNRDNGYYQENGTSLHMDGMPKQSYICENCFLDSSFIIMYKHLYYIYTRIQLNYLTLYQLLKCFLEILVCLSFLFCFYTCSSQYCLIINWWLA